MRKLKLFRSVSFCCQILPAVFLFVSIAVATASADAADSITLQRPEVEIALFTLEKTEYAGELEWWSCDDRGGREPGTPGSIEAGNYAAAQFQSLGLLPVGDVIEGKRSYFQYLDRGGKRGLFDGARFAVGDIEFEYGKDWALLGGCEKVSLDSVEVVFAGYGITAPKYEYDDYEGIDASGKAVLILRYEPQEMNRESAWNGAKNTSHSFFNSKLKNASEHGAAALLFVNGPLHHDPDMDPLSNLSTTASRGSTIPMIHVRRNVADSLLEASGLTIQQLQEKIDANASPASKRLGITRFSLSATVGELARARNVMGLLEGSDPLLKEEVVVVGAHYDHLGLGSYGSRTPDRKGEVHNGADDNASGSVGVVEMAEAFVEAGLKPKRSILFQLYDAEEKGLIGSRYYVKNPVFPLEKTVAMINMDMIAHSEQGKCSIMGTASSKEWEELLGAAENGSSIAFSHSGGGFGGSDQASFLASNIPVLFFFTGIHSAYHTPDDDVDRCDMNGAVEILKVAFKTVLLVADRDEPLSFVKQERSSRGRPRARFGLMVEPVGENKTGLRITELTAGGGAEKAGFQIGDVLIDVDGTELKGMRDLFSIIRSRKPGDTVKVRFQRKDEELEVDMVLGGRG